MNTGSIRSSGRPSMGAWVTYGIGSEAQDLPGFVVLQSGPRGPRGGAALWSSGFLPTLIRACRSAPAANRFSIFPLPRRYRGSRSSRRWTPFAI